MSRINNPVTGLPAEQWTLNGVELHDPANGIGIRDLSIVPAARRASWLDNPDADGAILGEPPRAGMRTIKIKLAYVPQASMDTALAKVGTIVDALESCRLNPDGVPLVWYPDGATKAGTLWAKLGEVDDVPVALSGEGRGWFAHAPVLAITLTTDPFMDLVPLANVVDDFSINTLANYTFDAGAGTLSVSGGQLVPSSTVEKRLYHSAAPYDCADAQVTLKFVTGATGGVNVNLLLKRLGASSALQVQVSQTTLGSGTGGLAISKYTGTSTDLGGTSSGAMPTLAASTAYWVRGRIEGNLATVEFFTSAPTPTSTPVASKSVTLTGSDATTWGAGVAGRQGIRVIPGDTNWRFDDLTIEPNLRRASTPVIDTTVYHVPGDAPAKGKMIVRDAASQHRRHLEWGAGADATSPMILDSDSLVTSGFGGTQATLSGAYDPDGTGTNVIQATLTALTGVICSTGEQPHIGTFRVRGRVLVAKAEARMRLVWRDKDGPFQANAWAAAPATGALSLVDFGVIVLDEEIAGNQTWNGRIEAYSSTGGLFQLDELELIPVDDGYGVAQAAASDVAGSLVGLDQFTGTTAGSNLSGRTPALGAPWATSGAANDFTFCDANDSPGAPINEALKRMDPSPSFRFAVFGSAMTDQQVQCTHGGAYAGGSGPGACGLIARWVDASNYLRFTVLSLGVDGFANNQILTATVTKVIAGVETVLATLGLSKEVAALVVLGLSVSATGAVTAFVQSGSATVVELSATDSALSTGGTLQSGLGGIIDSGNNTPVARYYDDVELTSPPPEPIVVYSGQDLQVLNDRIIRASSDGSRYGRPASYQPAGFLELAPAGAAGRATRVAVRAHRNNLETSSYVPTADLTQVQVLYTPRAIVVPR